ncbi:methionine adenosyltransferase [Acetobacteraceae bacterium]|nr:methionine adenosyltransferase [Candidatus Parcubacteria bacterium]
MFNLFKYYTTESVTAGHPDKVCDQISDAILDAALAQDPRSRVAIEVVGSHGALLIAGEIKTNAQIDFEKIARRVYTDIGYEDNLEIAVRVAQQSSDIAQGVDTGGAGDQGIMYGFATDETKEFLPQGVVYAHALARKLEELRRIKILPFLRPDGKTQVTIKDGRIVTALTSTQHTEEATLEEIREGLTTHLFPLVLGDISNVEILVNPTGRFVQGGFDADAGLTGRKIMVDTYGGLLPHGGGAFSGKDSTKVDRSAAYMARFAAKNLVANGYAKRALVSVAYAIGRVDPVMVEAVDDTGKNLSEIVQKNFDFRPNAIIERLGLRRPIFRETAAYGHFGVESRPWEKIEKI